MFPKKDIRRNNIRKFEYFEKWIIKRFIPSTKRLKNIKQMPRFKILKSNIQELVKKYKKSKGNQIVSEENDINKGKTSWI